MARIVVLLVALLGLLLAGSVTMAAGTELGSGPVYSMSMAQAGLARDPQAWAGRTVRVRGVASVAGCSLPARGTMVLCATPRFWFGDAGPNAALTGLPLAWEGASPLTTFLRRVPFLNRLTPRPQAIQWDVVATYRVRFRALAGAMCGSAYYEVVLLDAAP